MTPRAVKTAMLELRARLAQSKASTHYIAAQVGPEHMKLRNLTYALIVHDRSLFAWADVETLETYEP